MTHFKAISTMNNLGLTMAEYIEFLTELKSSVDDQINEVKKYLAKKNQKDAVDIMHSIKGSVGTLGLTDSYKSCQNVESSFKVALNDNSLVLMEEFIKIYTTELSEIQQTL
jgi:HPt (histidine-containing phosphotransfer) domain-containing protein